MHRILDFIEKEGGGRYSCYKTKKYSLDDSAPETLDYDDRTASSTFSGKFAETDLTRKPTVRLSKVANKLAAYPLFSFFLDGSRHVYKVDDIGIGNSIYPFLAGQIIVGCCERKSREEFKCCKLKREVVVSLPVNFNYDDDKEDDFCRAFCENVNNEINNNIFVKAHDINIDKLLLYRTDGDKRITQDRNGYKDSGTSRIQTEMTDQEQKMVADLCRKNQLDNEHYLIKDGSLEYNVDKTKMNTIERSQIRLNYKYVVGVSKMFNPDLLKDYQGRKLSKTIAELKPFERTKVYRYHTFDEETEYAIWYLRLRNSDFRETHFSDVVKCEMILEKAGDSLKTELVDIISANLIKEAYPVCFGKDSRWANHLYPVYLTETYCKSKYIGENIILNLF